MSERVITIPSDQDQRCNLSQFGIGRDFLDVMFFTIVNWLEGKELPYQQTKYINHYNGPSGKSVVELMFFHYDGPPEAEVGGGGEHNHCKLYLYDDHMNIVFVAEGESSMCGLTFKYSSKYWETDHYLMRFLIAYLNTHQMRIFENEPRRFNGMDPEVEAVKKVVDAMNLALSGDGLLG